MIESQLDPLTDGTGGGYGNYPGLTVAGIAERFRHLADEGHNRSARAILRIVHEQTAARGTLVAQRYLAGFGLSATTTLVVFRLLASTDALRAKLNLYLGATAAVTVLLVGGAVSVHRTTVRNDAQVREIRRLALLALTQVIEAPGFRPKPLEREHLKSLGELKGVDRGTWERVASALSPNP